MSLGLYCSECGVAAESSGMVARLPTRCSGRHWTADTAVVELIVRCVQFRSALTTNDTGCGSTKHEQDLIVMSGVEVGHWRSVLDCWSSGTRCWYLARSSGSCSMCFVHLAMKTLNISHIEVECFVLPHFVGFCVKMSINAATEVTEYLRGHVWAKCFEISLKSAQTNHRSIKILQES